MISKTGKDFKNGLRLENQFLKSYNTDICELWLVFE